MVVGEFSTRTDLVVVGADPAGIAAAGWGRVLGLDVILVDHPRAFAGFESTEDACGLDDLEAEGVTVMTGSARFDGGRQLTVAGDEQVSRVRFRRAVLAIGAGIEDVPSAVRDAFANDDDRVIPVDDGAVLFELVDPHSGPRLLGCGASPQLLDDLWNVACLALDDEPDPTAAPPPPSHLLLLPEGRGIPGLAPGFDDDVDGWIRTSLASVGIECLAAAPDAVSIVDELIRVEGVDRPFDVVLVSAGGPPSLEGLGLDATDVATDDRGFVLADESGRTGDQRILAVGAVRGPVTASGVHRSHALAIAEGRCAAEVAAGRDAALDPTVTRGLVCVGHSIAWCRRSDAASFAAVDVEQRGATFADGDGETEPTPITARLSWESSTGVVLGGAMEGTGATGAVAALAALIEMGGTLDDVAALVPVDDEGDGEALALLARHAVRDRHAASDQTA